MIQSAWAGAVPADGCTDSFGTLLSGPLCPVMDDMTYWEKLEALGGDTYDYDAGVDSQPGPFDYDDLRNYEEWCDWNDVNVEKGYYNPFQPDENGKVCLSRGCIRDGHRCCSCCFGHV